MRIAVDRVGIILSLHILLFCQNTVEQDCNGVYIDFMCHTFALDSQPWDVAEEKCINRLSVVGYTGAHLASIGSADKQRQIEDFFIRFGIGGAWLGATNKPLLWQWLSSKQAIQAQGCYNDDGNSRSFSYRVTIAGISSEGCIDACRLAGYGYAGIQAGSNCVCANTLNASALTVGCRSPCAVATSLSQWCGGPGLLTTVYKIGGANGQWGYNEPDIIPLQKSCAVLDMKLDGKMADESCSMKYDYLCEINTTTCSGQGFQQFSFLCYYVSSETTTDGITGVDWNMAAQKCEELGGVLATIDSPMLQSAIHNWISSRFPNQNKKIWIGAFRGGWYWLAGYSFAYTNWAPNEPKNNDEDRCLFVNKSVGYKWIALPCNMSKDFICQRGYDTFTTPKIVWTGPTPPAETGGTGSTGGKGNTGSTKSNTGSTISTGSMGQTYISEKGNNFSNVWSTTLPFYYSTTENSTELPGPDAAKSTTPQGWSKLAIGLFALLGIFLFLLLLLALIFLALCIARNLAGGNKVGCIQHYDARPIAHVPNSGEEFSSTTSLKKAAEPPGMS